MQRLEVSGAVRPIYGSLGVKRLTNDPRISAQTSASYYMCWYTMNEVPSLAKLGEPCDNFADCLDPQFGASNGDPRADDGTPFQCATYSFCPGKYVDTSNLLLFFLTPPMKMEQTECSETSSYKIQTPRNHPKERMQYQFIVNPPV